MADQTSGEQDILDQIHGLIESEHHLRAGDHDRDRLRQIEEALDQCWDLLRQRRAHHEFDQSPKDSAVRPVSEVEHYQQ